MEKEILSQPANGRFAIVEKCKDCDYAKYEYVGAKSVVASYYGVVDGAPHTISVTDLSDAGVRTEIRYGNSADSCTMTSAPNYTDKGQYDVYYQITYTYQGVEMTENGVANVSVGKIFFAAIVPGLVLSLFYMIYVFVICHIHPDYGPAMTTEELAAMPLRERITGSLINLIPPVILIVGVLGSIFTGWATPTEAAGVGALFSLILAIFYKQFSWKMLYDSLIDTAKTSAMVFIILFGASAFTGIFMSLDGDQLIATWISSVGIGKWGAFAIMMAIVFFMGMFLDWLGIVMIVFPIFLPIMDMFGFDRLWIVAVTAVMLQTCFMTPPFGFALFYIKGIVPPSVKIQEIYRGVIPFILIIIAVVILVTAFPQIVYFLPNLVAS